MIGYEPSVRGDAMLLAGGRQGTTDDTLVIAAGLLLDAALLGLIDVTGARRFGFDRRRVVLGPNAPGENTPPLLADLHDRVTRGTPETPWGWCERVAVFGFDAVSDELIRSHTIELTEPMRWRKFIRHSAIRVLDPDVAHAAAERVRAAAAGSTTDAEAVALTILLRETSFLGEVLGGEQLSRQTRRALSDGRGRLPGSARAILDTLEERRKRGDRIGGWMADD